MEKSHPIWWLYSRLILIFALGILAKNWICAGEILLGERLRQRGGLAGYSEHVREAASKFDHITVHPDIWTQKDGNDSMGMWAIE
jgi:hypothetical protein